MTKRLGRYEIRGQLGQGGFATVCRAWDPHLEREVAIKVCDSASREVRDRFVREAKISAKLFHPHIVTTFDVGSGAGSPFLVQELLAGEDLDVKAREGESLPVHLLLGWLLDLARALAYSHGLGIVHRDVKPANLRVLPDHTLKVMDFGIARALEAQDKITRPGFSIGTVTYASPEQLRGEAVDARFDIYSFGVTAYELLTSKLPFEADSIAGLVRKIATQDPRPIRVVWPACPADLGALVERCMAKDPDLRFAAFAEVVDELAWIRHRMALESEIASPMGAPSQTFRAGEWIFAQGDRGRSMYIIADGQVEILQEGQGLIDLREGDFFGEMSLLETAVRTASARALTDCRLEVIDASSFDIMIRLNPEIAVRMMRKLGERIRQKDEIQRAEIEVEYGGTLRHTQSGREFPLATGRDLSIGRLDQVTGIRPDIDLTEVDEEIVVSRRHARLIHRDGRFHLREEVGVANGTWVNDERLDRGTERALESGDRLAFASVELDSILFDDLE